MLLPGTYDLQFEADGYDPVVITDVVVSSGAATVLNVPMGPPAYVTYPNGGESLNADEAIDITWVGNPTTRVPGAVHEQLRRRHDVVRRL